MKENPFPLHQNSSLNINIFRHGESVYDQKEVPIEEASDLTAQGMEDVARNAEKLADLIKPDEDVEIWSSPVGRTLHTAKIISQILQQKGVHFRVSKQDNSKEYGIKIWKQLTEVKNFSWKLFYPLVVGGEVEFAGRKFFIDKNFTNPKNIDISKYFSEDGIRDIDLKYKQTLPKEYVEEIEGFEKFINVTKRLMLPLSRLKKIRDKSYRIIIVTHDALSGFIANVFSGGGVRGISSGEFINLERVNGKLVAKKVGNLEEGNNTTDMVDEFNRRYSLLQK